MAKDIAFKITVETDVADMSIGELRQGFRQLSDEMKGVNVGTDEYRKKLLKLGEVKGALNDLKQQINALDPEKRFAAFAKLGSTVASGFAAAQGAMAIFGSESEDLQKVLVRVQAAMALAQGLQGLQGFEKSLNMARMALIAFVSANPIMAIVGAITALSAGIVYLAEKWRESNSEVGKMEVAIEKLNKVSETRKEQLSEELRLLEAYGDRQEDVLKKKREIIVEDTKQAYLSLFLAQAKRREAIEESNYIDIVTAFFSPAAAEQRRATRLLESNQEIKDQEAKLAKLKTDLTISYIEEEKLTKKKVDKKKDALAFAAYDEAKRADEIMKQTNDLLLGKIDDNDKEKEDRLVHWYDRKKKIDDEASREKQKTDEEIAREELRREKFVQDQKFILAAGAFRSIGELSTAFAGQSEKSQRRAFEINKMASIAATIIDTYSAAQGAYKSQMSVPSPDAPVRAAIAAAIAVAQGLARVAIISKTKFESSSIAGSVSTPNIGGAGQSQASNQLTTGSTTINSSGTGFNQPTGPMRAYVVETDITSTQNTIRSIQERTTF